MKLLVLALQKRDYELAAHVLVYGLVKASLARWRDLPRYHGNKSKRTAKG